MSHKKHAASAPLQPRRALHSDFTTHTMRHAVAAKRRANAKQQIRAFFKEPFSMKLFTFLRTVPGALLAVAVIATTGVGAYAFTNWFNANVTVKHKNSVMSVDLSQCKGNLPPGIEPNTDRRNVRFKILGASHISAEQLQHQLMAECEYNAVVDFYRSQSTAENYMFRSGKIKAATNNTITLDYLWGGTLNAKTFSVNPDTTFYSQGKRITLYDLRLGDTVVFATEARNVLEGVDPLEDVSAITSIFRTQYDTKGAPGATKKAFYEEGNIMPLDMYNQLHQ